MTMAKSEEPPEIISTSSQTAEEIADNMLPLDKEPAAMETAIEKKTADHGGEEPSKAAPPSQQVTEENDVMMFSSDGEPAAAEITAERTETPDKECTEEIPFRTTVRAKAATSPPPTRAR